MEFGVVSPVAIAGMIFSLIIAVVLPIALIIIAKVKYNAKLSTFFIGVGTFVLFAMILEQIMHVVVIGAVGQDKMTANVWLYGLYGGMAAAVFEETGRLIAMKFFMKKRLDRANAFMYGIGHGGGEAIIIVGLQCISNIATAIAVNTGMIQASLSLLDDNTREITYQQLSQLWTLPAYQFFFAGIERISAITCHIVMTFFTYKGVKSGKKAYIAIAYAIHFVIDFSTVVMAQYASIVVVESVLLVMAAVGVFAAYKVNRSEE